MKMLKQCLNPKVLVGLAAVAVILYFVAPGAAVFGGFPLLILLICPLMMLLMMRGRGSMGSTNTTPAPAAAPSLRRVETESPNR